MRRRRKIGLADLQMNDVFPLLLERARPDKHFKRRFGPEPGHFFGKLHWPLSYHIFLELLPKSRVAIFPLLSEVSEEGKRVSQDFSLPVYVNSMFVMAPGFTVMDFETTP